LRRGHWRATLGPVWYLLYYGQDHEVIIAFDWDEDAKKASIIETYLTGTGWRSRSGIAA